jgi:hypothetical protein
LPRRFDEAEVLMLERRRSRMLTPDPMMAEAWLLVPGTNITGGPPPTASCLYRLCPSNAPHKRRAPDFYLFSDARALARVRFMRLLGDRQLKTLLESSGRRVLKV